MMENDRLIKILVAGLLIALSIIANCVQAANYVIAGDTGTYLKFSIGPFPPEPYGVQACYQMVGKPASATWTVDGNAATSGALRLSSSNSSFIIVTTAGIDVTPPSGSTAQYIEISYGSNAIGPGGCLNTDWVDFNYFVVDPTLSVSPNGVGVVLQQPSLSESANVTVSTYPHAAGLTITGTCTALNGPTFTPASVNGTTNASGVATFPITLNNAVVVAPSGSPSPSASCSFTAGGTSTAALNFQTFGFDPTLSLFPNKIVNTGTTTIQASTFQHWQGIQINALCASNGSNIVVNPVTAATDAAGNASFAVTASNLVGFGSVPTPSCTFKVNGGTGSAVLSFSTGDACTFGLQPNPPQCGNP